MVLCIFRSFLPISKEDILHFRNLGEKTILELEQICQEYNIEIRSMLSIREYFDKYRFPSKIYPMLFQNNISCIDDFKHMTANDLYLICQKDYILTMQTYFILKENGLLLNDWQDKFIFEFFRGKMLLTYGKSLLNQTLVQFKRLFPINPL